MAQFREQLIGGHYRIKSVLGQQSGRRTFLAEDEKNRTLVVIKLVLFGPDFSWEDLKLFEREAETLKSLDHPAIPKYLDSFEVDTLLGRGFALVQTYIEAQSLEAWVVGGRQFTESDLQPTARALLSILYYLHSCYPAVIHRDIKPSNILLSKASAEHPAKLYLVDFGAVQTAKKEGTMTVVGTYGYMPPEQFSGRAKPASDLYSLGATLIYLATGKHPAELTQDNLSIEFTPYVRFAPSFTRWLTQLTEPSLSQRTSSAHQALRQLTQGNSQGNFQSVHQRPDRERTNRERPDREKTVSQRPASPCFISPAQATAFLNRRDFEIVSTPEWLEIQCLRSRIREPLRAKETFNNLTTCYKRVLVHISEAIDEITWGMTAAIYLISAVPFVMSGEVFGPLILIGLLMAFIFFWMKVPVFWYPTILRTELGD